MTLLQKKLPTRKDPLKVVTPPSAAGDLREGIKDESLEEQTEAELRAVQEKRAQQVKAKAKQLKEQAKRKKTQESSCGCW